MRLHQCMKWWLTARRVARLAIGSSIRKPKKMVCSVNYITYVSVRKGLDNSTHVAVA